MTKSILLFSILSLQALSGEINGIIKGNKDGLEDYSGFIVYIKEGQALPTRRASKKIYEVAQVNKKFSPAVRGIEVGSSIDYKNYDEIFHNVFSLSPKKKFDLGIYKGEEQFDEKFKPIQNKKQSTKVKFNNPGKIKVFCNIHEDMMSTVYVFNHSYFSQVNKNGHFKLPIPKKGKVTIVLDGDRLKRPISKKFDVTKIKRPLRIKFKTVDKKPVPKHFKKDGKEYDNEWSLNEDEFY
jgi:plastocyanin